MAPEARDPGSVHLTRIGWIQGALLPLGAVLWLLRSGPAALVFLGGGVASLAFWHLHRWIVARMLTPSVPLRWLFGALVVLKLALIVLVLRGMMVCFPKEVIPFISGLLLFIAAILLEAIWLVFRPEEGEGAHPR